jgi:hypothetical protein
MNTPPLSFASLAQTAPNPASGGYPYRIRGTDLDKNFVFATLQIDPTLVQSAIGAGGHQTRKLKIPAVPSTGTHVLGAKDGTLQWLPTEEC